MLKKVFKIYSIRTWEWKYSEDDIVCSGYSFKSYSTHIVTACSAKNAISGLIKLYGKEYVENKANLLGNA